MVTLLIILSCILAHTVAASGTNYLLERLDLDSESFMVFAAVPLCMTAWPLVLIGTVIALAGRMGKKRALRWRDEALESRKAIAERDAIIAGLKIKPPVMGVHR